LNFGRLDIGLEIFSSDSGDKKKHNCLNQRPTAAATQVKIIFDNIIKSSDDVRIDVDVKSATAAGQQQTRSNCCCSALALVGYVFIYFIF
jgi:hypothetical protein